MANPIRSLFAACAVAVLICLAAPAQARADAVTDYYDASVALEDLLKERAALELQVDEAAAGERTALARLEAAEKLVAQLVAQHTANVRQGELLVQRLVAFEAEVPAIEESGARLDRRIEAQERWLFEGEQPRALSMRGYRAALDARDRLAADRSAAAAEAASVRAKQASLVLDLGRINTEIRSFEGQADTLSRQVGTLRSRALRASSRLSVVQKTGLEKARELREQFDALRRAGHPVGIAAIASTAGLPIPEPLAWPETAPKTYSPPTGAFVSLLRLGEPLRLTVDQVGPLGAFSERWTRPVRGPITTPYGDSTPYQAAHWAVDIGTRLYEPVQAASAGVVEYAGLAAGDNRLASYGMVVLVRHSERVTSLYAHLDDRAHGVPVKVGDTVEKGQVLGYVGLTGYTTGPHLHFEVRVDGQPIDPLLVLQP